MKPDLQEFESLRRLIALKRYEQPPPGYFDRFSSAVIARIQAGERAKPDSVLDWLVGETSWLHRIWSAIEMRPAFAGVFGVAICVMMISGILYSEDTSVSPDSGITPLAGETASPFTAASATVGFTAANVDRPQLVSSTNPVAPSVSALFDQFQLTARPADFSFPAGN